MLRIDKIKFFLFLLIFFHLGSNFLVLKADSSPLLGEQFNNFVKSVSVYHLLRGGETFLPDSLPHFFGLVDAVYPPLMYFGACVFYAVFGVDVFAALFSVSFFFALLILYSYKCYALFMKKQDALFCTAVLSFVPGVYGFSRILHVDFVLLSLLSVTCYYLFVALEKDVLKYWVLAGFFSGLSFLSKQSAAIFLFPIAVYICIDILRKKIKAANVFVCAVACFLTACFWYFLNLSNDNSLPLWALCQEFDFLTGVSFLKSYLFDMRIYLLGNVVFVVGFCSMLCALVFIRNKFKFLFAGIVCFSLLFFSFIAGIYSVRYLVPVIFFLCFFIPLFLNLIFPGKFLGHVVKGILIVSMLVPFVLNLKTREYVADDLILKADKQGLLSPLKYSYDVSSLIEMIQKSGISDPKVATLFNTLESDYLRFAVWDYSGKKIQLETEGLVDVFHGGSFAEFVEKYDVLIMKIDQDSLLLKQSTFPDAFVYEMKKKIFNLRDNSEDISLLGDVDVLLAADSYRFLVFSRR